MLSSTNNDREVEEEKGEAEGANGRATEKDPAQGIHLQNSASSPTLPKGGTNTA